VARDSFSSSDKVYFVDEISSLSLLQKQQCVPVPMLARIWGLRNEDEATEVVTWCRHSALSSRCAGKVTCVVCITLHDLTHDACVVRASREGGAAVWHRRLIDAYSGELVPAADTLQPENVNSTAYVPWWSDKLADDGYVHLNLALHFVNCSEEGVEKLAALLLDFRWIERQLTVNDILSLRADFELLRSAASPTAVAGSASGDSVGETNMWPALDFVPAAVQLV
jgi:hypothetical protein